MEDKTYEKIVTLPDKNDFLKKYPRFSSLFSGEGRKFFDLVMQPNVFVEASVLADLGYPSVLAVAQLCHDLVSKSENLSSDSFTKQFIGSMVCALMEANGYKKSGIKKSVPHEMFSTGECYQRDLEVSRIKSIELCGTIRLANLKRIDKNIQIS